MSDELMTPSNHLILCCSLCFLSSTFPSIRGFSNEPAFHKSPKYWSFSFSISPSNEYSELLSFKMGWSPCSPRDSQESSPAQQLERINSSALHLLYGTALTSVHDYRKNHTLHYTKFVRVMSLLFNILSRFLIAFIPRSKHYNFMSEVTICSDFGTQENKICHSFHFFHLYLSWSDGTICHHLSSLNAEF